MWAEPAGAALRSRSSGLHEETGSKAKCWKGYLAPKREGRTESWQHLHQLSHILTSSVDNFTAWTRQLIAAFFSLDLETAHFDHFHVVVFHLYLHLYFSAWTLEQPRAIIVQK